MAVNCFVDQLRSGAEFAIVGFAPQAPVRGTLFEKLGSPRNALQLNAVPNASVPRAAVLLTVGRGVQPTGNALPNRVVCIWRAARASRCAVCRPRCSASSAESQRPHDSGVPN